MHHVRDLCDRPTCDILQVMEMEPENATVKELYPLLQERIRLGGVHVQCGYTL